MVLFIGFNRCLSTQYFAGVVVHPVNQFIQLSRVDLREVGPFREPSADHAVMYFVGPLLPCGVAVAVVDLASLEELSQFSII